MKNYWYTIGQLTGKLLKGITPTNAYAQDRILFAHISRGYLLDPMIDPDIASSFIDRCSIYSNTLYNAVDQVAKADKINLLRTQAMHYLSAYLLGMQWTPGSQEPECIPFDEVRVMKAADASEIMWDVVKLCEGAIKTYQIEDIADFLADYNYNRYAINQIQNREMRCALYKRYGIMPDSGEDMVRQLVYNATGSTMLVKNKALIGALKYSIVPIPTMCSSQLVELATVFNRYKPIFLALKGNQNNRKIINYISKLSKIFHKPKPMGFWKTLSEKKPPLAKIVYKMNELSNFDLIRIINMCEDRLIRFGGNPDRQFIIRNGKVFIQHSEALPALSSDVFYFEEVRDILFIELVTRMKSKACSIKLPNNIELACPVSQKNFIGNIPFGSYVQLPNHETCVGIYWKGEDGADDLDISFIGTNGTKVGWNEDWSQNGDEVVFSGDMVTADPDAAEVLFGKNGLPDSIIAVNMFCGTPGTKYKLFAGTSPARSCENGTPMIPSKSITFSADMIMESDAQQILGLVNNNKMYLAGLGCGISRVSGANMLYMYNACVRRAQTSLRLRRVLSAAGFKIYAASSKKNVDIDLSSQLSASVLLDLFK